MRFHKYLLLTIVTFLASCTPISSEMTLEGLLEAHTEARGGMLAIERIKSIAIEPEITEPGFTINGKYIASRNGWVRIDIYSEGNRVFTEALGPDGGWQMRRDGNVTNLSPEGKAALERGLIGNLYGLHELKNLGYTLIFSGTILHNGVEYWDIETVTPTGFSEHHFLSKDTFLINRKIETSALHPDLNSKKKHQETIFSNYTKIENVIFSQKSEKHDLNSGETRQSVIIQSRTINVEIDETHFKQPTP